MILVDANLVLYAEDSSSAWNASARLWWDAQLSGSSPVCLSWEVVSAFLRLATNRRVFAHPLTLSEALERVQSWLDQPCIRIVLPTSRHWDIFQDMLSKSQAAGNLIPDAHLAALAIEHGCELYSTDVDFARFPGLKWKNPLRVNGTR